jgi:type IV conjugative transfer system pilin TraA
VKKLYAMFSKPRNYVADLRATKVLLAFLLSLGVIGVAHATGAGTDMLSSAAAPVSKTFGAGSTMAKWLILAEVIVGTIMYIKTKNMMLLMGAIVVVVFTSVGFGLAK